MPTHQAAGQYIFPEMIHRGHRMARRQGHELFTTRVEEWIGGHRERLDMLRNDSFECGFDLAVGARPQDMNLQIDRARGLLRVT